MVEGIGGVKIGGIQSELSRQKIQHGLVVQTPGSKPVIKFFLNVLGLSQTF